jgi:hypothetical protein
MPTAMGGARSREESVLMLWILILVCACVRVRSVSFLSFLFSFFFPAARKITQQRIIILACLSQF